MSNDELNPLNEGLDGLLLDDGVVWNSSEPDREDILTPEERIKALNLFIKGFEKWSQLNEDCRLHVVKYLDYKSRSRLERCSKQDQITVKNTPIHITNMVMLDNDKYPGRYSNEPFDNVKVEVEFDNINRKYSTRTYNLVFSQDGTDTKRQWLKCSYRKYPKVRTLVIKNSNYYEEAVKFAEGLMKKSNFELDRMRIDMSKYPWQTSQIRTLSFCKDARIGVSSLEQLRWWFSKLPENMERLYLYPMGEDEDEFLFPAESLDVPQTRTVQSLAVSGKVGYTDEQLLGLRNRSIDFNDIAISDETINRYIKRWITGNCYEDFEQAHLGSMDNRNLDVILDGIEVIPWDEDFVEKVGFYCSEFHRFCGAHAATYQITSLVDPYQSLTLNFYHNDFYIYHTGMRRIYKGETETEYLVPRGFL